MVVPLAQLAAIDPDESPEKAIGGSTTGSPRIICSPESALCSVAERTRLRALSPGEASSDRSNREVAENVGKHIATKRE